MPTVITDRDAARLLANRYRSVQKMFKQNIAKHPADVGLSMVREAIVDPPAELSGMRIEKVLMAVRRVGLDKSAAILRKAHISPTRKLRDLTDNERERLSRILV